MTFLQANKRVKVCYRFHPFCGQEAKIVLTSKRAGEDYFLVSFFDKPSIYLAQWMTDPLICQDHTVSDQPSCCLAALTQLREFLDQF